MAPPTTRLQRRALHPCAGCQWGPGRPDNGRCGAEAAQARVRAGGNEAGRGTRQARSYARRPSGNLGDMTARALEALRVGRRGVRRGHACDRQAAGRVPHTRSGSSGWTRRRIGRARRVARASACWQAKSIVVLLGRRHAGRVRPGPAPRARRRARRGVPVEVLPGPTAAATAYVASGCANPRFYFGGFFPRKDAERQRCAGERCARSTRRSCSTRARTAWSTALDRAGGRASRTREVGRVPRARRSCTRKWCAARLPRACATAFAARERAGAGIKGEIVVVVDGPSAAEERGERAQGAKGRPRTRAPRLSGRRPAGQGQIARRVGRRVRHCAQRGLRSGARSLRGRVEPGKKRWRAGRRPARSRA